MAAGRPIALDDIMQQRILKALASGLPRDTACKLAGITATTFYKYMKLGRDGDERFTEFLVKVKAAEARSEDELVQLIRQAAGRQWQAAAWLLERRMPHKYALRRPEPREEEVTGEQAEKILAEAADLHHRLKAVSE